jgi:hypothetical protein
MPLRPARRFPRRGRQHRRSMAIARRGPGVSWRGALRRMRGWAKFIRAACAGCPGAAARAVCDNPHNSSSAPRHQ